MQTKLNRSFKTTAAVLAFLLAFFGLLTSANQATASPTPVAFTVARAGWNVVGLDSNRPADGPNSFPQGIKVCNTSSGIDASNIDVTWNWTSTNVNINLDGLATRNIPSLAAGACTTVWWTVTVTRVNAAYDTSRNYTVTATDGSATTTSTTQLVYVEHLVSQARNQVSGVAGPSNVTLGDTVTFTLTGATATNGYEQIVTAPILSSSIFEITSITGTYAVGGSVTNFYLDACGWDPAGTSRLNWDCIGPTIGTGKAGGDPITVTVTAKIIGVGTTQVGGIIYDLSGGSFHYNADYADSDFTVTAAAPVVTIDAVDDAESTTVDVPVDVTVLNNDTAQHDTVDPTSVTITQNPAHGTLSVNPTTGVVTYTPDAGWYGTDTFNYSIKATGDPSKTDSATVTITIPAPPTAPTATDDAETTNVDTPVEVDVPLNDTPGSHPLDPTSVNVTSNPTHGTVSVNPTTGKITYTPNSGYTGEDTFVYEICDTGTPALCDTATVTITIVPANTPPTAVDDVDDTLIDTPVDVPVLDNDIEGSAHLDPNAVTITTQPSHGSVTVLPLTGEIRYLPDSGWFGTDTFYYQVCDLNDPAQCDIAKVTITVPEGPAPLEPPVATDESDTTPLNTAITVDVLANDTPGTGDLVPSTVRITEGPTHGTASVDPTTGKITFTPDDDYTGVAMMTYEICDDNRPQLCDTATVTITIVPANTPPTAVDDVDETLIDTPVDVPVLDNDVEGSAHLNPNAVTITTRPSHGTVTVLPLTGEIRYLPDSGWFGTDTFYYQVCDLNDPVQCDIAKVTITVPEGPAPTEAPTATDDADSTPFETPIEIDVLHNDTPGGLPLNPASVTVTSQPSNGTVTVDPATGKITYTPDKGFSGTDTFTYQVCDTGSPALCATAEVTVLVSPEQVKGGPEATDDSAETDINTPVEIDVLKNDLPGDAPLDPSSVKLTHNPEHGTVTVDPATGKITYTPDPDFSGEDTFIYEICDTFDPANCVSAVVEITVNPINKVNIDEVFPVDKVAVIDPTTLDPNAPEIDPTTVEIVTPPNHGTVEVDPVTGKITYTPEKGYKGTDSFSFRAQNKSNPTRFVDFKYSVYLAGEEETLTPEATDDGTVEKSTDGLAYTGSAPFIPAILGGALVAVGLLVRRRKA